MVGRRLQPSPSISRLTSRPDKILSKCRRSRHRIPTPLATAPSLSEKPSQFSVELPIRVKVPIHESSHHVSRQRGYLLTITARMNLDPLPGTVTPSRRSALHRARPVEQPRHGIVSGNNDAAARGIAAAVLRRYCQELSRGGVT